MIDIKTGKEIENPAVLKAPLAGSAKANVARGMMRGVGARRATMFGEKLPYDREVKCLITSGHQCIDTGVVPNNHEASVTFAQTTRIQETIVEQIGGCWNANNQRYYIAEIAGTVNIVDRFDYPIYFYSQNLYKHTVIKCYQKTNQSKIDDNDPIVGDFGTPNATNNFYIGSIYYNGGGYNFCNAKFYSTRLTNLTNRVDVRDYKAVIDKQGRPCFWDSVSNSPFYNISSGEFGWEEMDGTVHQPV